MFGAPRANQNVPRAPSGRRAPRRSRRDRAVVRIHEATGSSTRSWDAAVRAAIAEGRKEVKDVVAVEVVRLTGGVRDGRISSYRALVRLAYKEPLVGP